MSFFHDVVIKNVFMTDAFLLKMLSMLIMLLMGVLIKIFSSDDLINFFSIQSDIYETN